MIPATFAQPAPDADAPQVRIQRLRFLRGCVPGLTQPAVVASLQAHAGTVDRAALDTFDALAAQGIDGYAELDPPAGVAAYPVWGRIARAALALLQEAGMPAPVEATLLARAAGSAELALPAVAQQHRATAAALDAAVGLLNAVFAGQAADAAPDFLERARDTIRRAVPKGFNTRHFLLAAQAAGIPWRLISDTVIQYGWGARARWLDNSFTDTTPFLGTRMAQDKRQTARLLRLAGLPVPRHGLAADAEAAVKLAAELGYPVVVKPADRDGGQGVAAGLPDADAVAWAYAKARAISPLVLVEEHVAGNDYRLQVYQGEVYWVAHRVPASVTGDGTRTVRQLVAQINAEREAAGPRAPLAGRKPIALEEEALALLDEQGLMLDAVPEAGRWVRLHRAANVATGGVPVAALEDAHADNLALAVRAARVLRLDVAGIDLLIPDIRTSWLESGAAICEVNAQPQLSSHLPAYLLSHLVAGDGRIPVVMVLGNPGGDWIDAWRQRSANGHGIGVATAAGVWVDGVPATAPMDSFTGGMALLADPAVEAAMMVVEDVTMLKIGVPVDRVEVLVLAGPLTAAPDAPYPKGLARMLAGMSARVLVNSACAGWMAAVERWPAAPGAVPEVSAPEVAEAGAIDTVLDAVLAGRRP